MRRVVLRRTIHVCTEKICVMKRGERKRERERNEGGWKRKRKNSLPKVLSTADRLIHFRINRFDQPGSHSGSLRSFSTISLLRRLVSHPPGFFLPSTVPRRNKQLLSTFRPAKWEKAVGVQLATSLTGFARISTTEM